MQGEFSITNQTGMRLPRLPVLALKNEILGKNYTLSVAYVKPAMSQAINRQYRKKNKPTNVLSFELSTNSGELVLCPEVIKKETKKFGKNFRELLEFLIIHGMLHLKGYLHDTKKSAAEMEAQEKIYLSRTKFLKK